MPWTRIARSPDVVASVVDNEIVLIHLTRGTYYGLEGTGRKIWEALEFAKDFDELCYQLENHFSGDRETIRNETSLFLKTLATEGAVELQ